jgi:hypothetical protein
VLLTCSIRGVFNAFFHLDAELVMEVVSERFADELRTRLGSACGLYLVEEGFVEREGD